VLAISSTVYNEIPSEPTVLVTMVVEQRVTGRQFRSRRAT
jgi:hypothetical protein